MKKDILIKNAKEYFVSGKEQLEKEMYNSSVVLFFKALVSLADLYILQNTGKTPSSHTERFNVTREKFYEVYLLLDKDFPFYQNSYEQSMTKELAEVIMEDVKILAKKTGIAL